MQISEILWVLMIILMHANLNFSEYTLKTSRINLLKKILKEQNYMSAKAKRTEGGSSAENSDGYRPVECCPSRTEGIAPLGALSREGTLLQLYRDTNEIQKFFQTICVPEVKGKSCNFVDSSVWDSSCEQQFTYMYAIVKDFNTTQPYRIDYIRVKSGCSCLVKGPAQRPEELARELAEDILHV